MRLRLLWLALVPPLALGHALHAQNPEAVPCLDTLAITSPQVLIGKIVDVQDLKTKENGSEVEVKVDRQLKGGAVDTRVKIVVEGVGKPTLVSWRDAGSQALFFYGYARTPTTPRYGPNAISLSDPGLKVLTADMRVLNDPQEIVRATVNAIESHPVGNPVPIVTFWLTDQASRSLGHADQAHCYCITSVPVDKSLEQLAKNEIVSGSGTERENGARLLVNFPTPANIELLRSLLTDPAVSQFHYYFVRAAAYDSLRRIGVAVAEPIVRDAPASK